MAMLSIKVHRFEKKHGRKIKYNGRENAKFDKKVVKCFNCKQMGHFSRECRAQSEQNSNNYQKYKSKEARKDGSNSKAMVVVDGSSDWDKQTEEGNTEPRSLENFGMVVLKGNSAKSMTTDKDGNLKIHPPVTAKEHQQVQREEKARTILLSALPDEHMGDFYHMIDARDI
nr:xylulose kinase-1 [Tanacetum cinerariifolium]